MIFATCNTLLSEWSMINLFYQTWYFHHFYFFKPNLARFHSCRNLWRSASVLLSVEFKFYWHIWLGLNLHRSITKTYQRGNEILKELFNNQFFIYMDVAKHVVKMMQSFRCCWFYVHPLIFSYLLEEQISSQVMALWLNMLLLRY